MPRLTTLDFASNAAIGFKGAAGLTPLTTLRTLMLPTQAIGDEGLKVRAPGLLSHPTLLYCVARHNACPRLTHTQPKCAPPAPRAQTIGASLTGLRELSLHNDGHVSDDGLVHLHGEARAHSSNAHTHHQVQVGCVC
jgi:hypothetical protein